MRAWGWVGGVVGWLGLAGGLLAQAGGDAVVRGPVAQVRGGPSEIFEPVGQLRQGDRVHVVSEKDGFYAITPPAGSSSWIMDRAISYGKPPANGQPFNAYVQLDDVRVRLGSPTSPRPLPVETVPVKRGTIIRVIGDRTLAEGTEWWRIQPPPAEVRYVARDALSTPSSASTVVAKAPANGTGSPAAPGTDSLWAQAEQAERAGDYDLAITRYRQLADEMAKPGGSHTVATRCMNRIDELTRLRAQRATWPARQPAPGVLVSGSARPNPVPVAPPAAAGAASPGGTVTSGPGWLRRTGVTIEGRPAYVLEDSRGQPRYYLLAQQGLNLETFVNRPVEVFGPMVQRPDLAGGGYISVNRLHLLR